MHQLFGWTATPSRLIGAPTSAIPFLAQPSQFILAWDRQQICWLAYPVAWFAQWLLQQREMEPSFVIVIFAVLLGKVVTNRLQNSS